MKSEKIQRALLRFLKEEKDRGVRGITIQDLHHSCCAGLAKSVGRIADVDDEIIWADLQEAAWALLSRGFLWLATDQIHSSSFWRFQFTDKGLAAANDEDVNPDNPERYMELLLKESPRTSETVQLYLKESLRAFDKDCFLSSAVMLGVAAEAWMLDTAGFYVVWAGKPAQKLAELLKNPRTFYVKKLEEFQKLSRQKSPNFHRS